MLCLKVIPLALRSSLAVLIDCLTPVRPWNKARVCLRCVEGSGVGGEGEEEEYEIKRDEGGG
jgi:hypothetical protein